MMLPRRDPLLESRLAQQALRLKGEPPGLALGRRFFLRETRTVARELLGAWILRRAGGACYGARIVEVEAYLGVEDQAAHSYGGRRTPRVEPMYAAGGHLYVYLIYGMHCCANVVTREAGNPQAVLLRAAEPPAGADPRLLAGPGKLCRALGIDRSHSGADLLGHPELELRLDPLADDQVVQAPRIGVDYAREAALWPLRLLVAGSRSVSKPAPRAATCSAGEGRSG